MLQRNFSPMVMFHKLALEHKPECAFEGETKEDFINWKAQTWPKVYKTLQDWPERVPLNAELSVEWKEDGLIKQRWIIDVGEYISAAMLVTIPEGLGADEKRPAILCWHGHGKFGKDSVMGIRSSQDRCDEINSMNYDYGLQMAKKGFVTFTIDWIGVGERNDSVKPHFNSSNGLRDWCNIYYLHATMLGMTSLSINITHGMAATDFACTLPNVDPDKIGVMGLSGGGTMTLWSALCDDRIKAVEIICYSGLWEYFGLRDNNYCGMQVAPGLLKLVNLPDLQGLLAPKPLLVDIGLYDECFNVENATECFKKVKSIYEAASFPDKLELDLFTANHGWGGNKSFDFFTKHLG